MRNVFLVAGGTGGHINAAISVGEELSDKYNIIYLSGTRYLDYQLFKNFECIHLDSKPLRTKNPFTLIKNILLNLLVFLKILVLFIKKKPSFILGAGGYVCGPTLLAGKVLGKPIFIIEQNAVAGLTNKLLAKISTKIFTNFKQTKGLEGSQIVVAGNPIRSNIKESKIPRNTPIRILVFGGSLGATQINRVIENIINIWVGKEIEIMHQVGKGNLTKKEFMSEAVTYRATEYIEDMDTEYEKSQIIIARAGASTISELRVVKRPAILIPYPAATDNHQWYNAHELKNEDLSYIEVLDPKLNDELLTNKVIEQLDIIINQEKFYQNKFDEVPAAKIIRMEVEKYVRS